MIFVTALPVFALKQNLETYAKQAMREAEVVGSTNISTRIDRLETLLKIKPTMNWDGTEYMSGNTSNVQLNNLIYLEVSQPYEMGFGEYISYEIVVKARVVGLSEVYYK